jgi:phosphoribosylanthranilate isomerase
MIVQIYEINSPEEAKAVTALGVNHIGVLIGKGKFPRELSYEQAKEIFKSLPPGTKSVGLSLSSNIDEIAEVIEKTNPDILHIGTILESITPSDTLLLKNRFPGLQIMRAIPVIDKQSVDVAKSYNGVADWLLLDTYKKGESAIGAVGETHDWQVSKEIISSVKIPVILAGGLGPDNVAEAIKEVRPTGVDSKTKTDKVNGIGKDLDKIKKFIEAVHSVV